jgi:hypothetical protein
MHLFVLAATLAVAFAAPQITSSGDDITVTGKSIKFSEVSLPLGVVVTRFASLLPVLRKPCIITLPSCCHLTACIQFQMAGNSNAVNRAFTITKDDIQFSSDSSDTYTMLVAVRHSAQGTLEA